MAGTEYFSLDVEDVPATGSRPDRLAGVRPQERVKRHTVEHIVDFVCFAPTVQILTAPVPQLAEQRVEVPTIISFSSLQRIVEQNVDIPVPGGGGRLAGLQCFLPRQSSTGVEQIVDIPGGGLQGFFAQDKVHLHHPHLQLVFMKTQMSLVKGLFALFPDLNKVRRSPGTRVRECCGAPAHPS